MKKLDICCNCEAEIIVTRKLSSVEVPVCSVDCKDTWEDGEYRHDPESEDTAVVFSIR